jgi:hypothetical protein
VKSAGGEWNDEAISVRRLAAAVVFVLLASCGSLYAAPPDISVALDRQAITIGDPVEYTLTIHYDTNLTLISPAIGASLGALTVLGDSTEADGKIADGRKLYQRRVRLTAFETGDLWLPMLEGELVDTNGYATRWQTDSLSLTVASMLAGLNPDSVDIQGLKSQYEVPISTWVWWAISAFIVMALAVAYWFWRRRRRIEIAAAVPKIPAWVSALGSLQMMREEVDPASDGGRMWYFGLSEILRRYLDGRYGWESIDETTTETIRRLPDAPFDGEHRERVQEFFDVADRVRYAKSIGIGYVRSSNTQSRQFPRRLNRRQSHPTAAPAKTAMTTKNKRPRNPRNRQRGKIGGTCPHDPPLRQSLASSMRHPRHRRGLAVVDDAQTPARRRVFTPAAARSCRPVVARARQMDSHRRQDSGRPAHRCWSRPAAIGDSLA